MSRIPIETPPEGPAGGIRHSAAALTAAVFLALPAVGAAQSVTGVVVAEGDEGPLTGAVVTLVDGAGTDIASRLTRPDGAYVFDRVVAGEYRLRVGLLGYRTVTTPPFTLAAGQRLTRRVAVPLEPIRLDGIQASRERRCDRDFGGTDLVRLWEEARKGLTAVALTERSPSVSFRLAVRHQDIDPDREIVLAERVQTYRSWRYDFFRAASVDSLLHFGFIQDAYTDDATYYAPDAQLLLSEAFLDRYCFGITDGDDGEVGLTFEPELDRQSTVQIEGTLWLDRQTAGLRRLRFRYTRSPVFGFDAGGEATYERLPTGAWIIRDWWIRMPRMAVINGTPTTQLGLIREVHGDVIEVLGTDRPMPADPASAAAVAPTAVADSGAAAGARDSVAHVAGPAPAPGREVTTWTFQATDPRRLEIYARNDSDAVVRITSVTLERCHNIRESCNRHPVGVTLQPGEQDRILAVHPVEILDAMDVEWSYQAMSF